MDKNPEVLETHETPEETTPEVEEVTLSKQELEDLKHRAGVSSQNYERAKKLEARIKELENIEIEPFGVDNEQFSQFQAELSSVKKKLEKSEVIETHPVLKEIWEEFETYLENPENAGLPMKTAARVFLAEKGALEPKRKGLEKPTGGTRTPISTGMTAEDVKRLRETNYKEYTNKLRKGQLKFS